jgi:hypothetical protein
MSEIHPEETQLARWSDGEARADVAAHVRWCARCRSGVADYRWLAGEIGATLTGAADAVDVPRPRWWALQGRLIADQRRRVAGWRASAVASVVLAVCLMLSLSPVLLSTAVAARMVPLEAMVVPAPLTAMTAMTASTADMASVSGTHAAPGATPTPLVSRAEATPAPTPDFALPPTPPEPET